LAVIGASGPDDKLKIGELMPVQLSIPLEGLQRAGRDLESAARRIAAGATAEASRADSVQLSQQSEAPPVDYPVELAKVLQARTAFKADLAALSAALDAEGEPVRAWGPRVFEPPS